jgi:hypothetical protein
VITIFKIFFVRFSKTIYMIFRNDGYLASVLGKQPEAAPPVQPQLPVNPHQPHVQLPQRPPRFLFSLILGWQSENRRFSTAGYSQLWVFLRSWQCCGSGIRCLFDSWIRDG